MNDRLKSLGSRLLIIGSLGSSLFLSALFTAESDPIIGSIVKVGYAAASSKFRQVAAIRSSIKTIRAEIAAKASLRVEVEAVELKKKSKLTAQDVRQLSEQYPSLAPGLKKAIDSKDEPARPSSGTKPGQPATPTPKPQASERERNKFDVYADMFDRRLLAINAPINEEGELTALDRLLGIEKANAIEPITVGIIGATALGIVAVTAISSIINAGVASASDVDKNEACKELLLKQSAGDKVAACEKRAAKRRKDRLDAERKGFNQCKRGLPEFMCAVGNNFAKGRIESDFEKDVDACS